MYEPRLPELQIVRSRISPESWDSRVEAARRDEQVMLRIVARVDAGEALNHAIAGEVEPARRSWVIRRWRPFREQGFESLIDSRVPREPKVTRTFEDAIEAARTANPRITVAEVLAILVRRRGNKPLPSSATIKRVFARVDERRRYAEKKVRKAGHVVDLPFAGGEFLLAAELETGGVAALADAVVQIAAEAREASKGQVPERDTPHREQGRFTAEYNMKRRRQEDEEIASYLRSAVEKAAGRVRSWPRFVRERRETLEPKLWMLTLGWMVTSTKGWDALRAPDVAGLEPLAGFAYLPATLAKLVSALAISAAGPRLLEAMGKRWHEVAQQRWGEAGAMAALYVDNHAKEVWSSLFTKSGKVSNLSGVMPCITSTYVHTGAGTPIVASVQSGSEPLAPRLVDLVEQVEKTLESEVTRAVVIDSEGCTFDILETFAKQERVVVTPLKPSRLPDLELIFTRGSYFRPYREHDQLRVGTGVLKHKSTGRTLEVGVLLLRRSNRDAETVLLTTGLALGREGRELADLYFSRWPIQENAFKDGGAVGLDEHRGNCGTMVNNVAVMTEIERLARRSEKESAELKSLDENHDALESAAGEARHAHERALARLAVRRRRVDDLIAEGKVEGKRFISAALDQQEAQREMDAITATLASAQAAVEHSRKRRDELRANLGRYAARTAELEPLQRIRQLDVAQDMVLTATKLTAMQLIGFACREYLGARPMTAQTFLEQVMPVKGRREIGPDEEVVVFHENPRNPEINEALRKACLRLNARKLSREGRRLRYVVETPEEIHAARGGRSR